MVCAVICLEHVSPGLVVDGLRVGAAQLGVHTSCNPTTVGIGIVVEGSFEHAAVDARHAGVVVRVGLGVPDLGSGVSAATDGVEALRLVVLGGHRVEVVSLGVLAANNVKNAIATVDIGHRIIVCSQGVHAAAELGLAQADGVKGGGGVIVQGSVVGAANHFVFAFVVVSVGLGGVVFRGRVHAAFRDDEALSFCCGGGVIVACGIIHAPNNPWLAFAIVGVGSGVVVGGGGVRAAILRVEAGAGYLLRGKRVKVGSGAILATDDLELAGRRLGGGGKVVGGSGVHAALHLKVAGASDCVSCSGVIVGGSCDLASDRAQTATSAPASAHGPALPGGAGVVVGIVGIHAAEEDATLIPVVAAIGNVVLSGGVEAARIHRRATGVTVGI